MKVQLCVRLVPIPYWDNSNNFHESTYWWRIVARNGQVVATSEAYSTKSAAKNMAKQIANMMNVPLTVVEV